MPKIIIDQEFKALLPALDKETFALLEENLLQNGCRDSIVLWGDILIDGHNRYEICSKHGIEFNTINRDFTSREEALIWIISTQVSRRNLSHIQLSHFRGLHYIADKKMHGSNRRNTPEISSGQNGNLKSTAGRLAGKYRVSPRTIVRDARTAAAIEAIGEISPPAKTMILSGEAVIDKYILCDLSEKPRKEIEAVAAAIEKGTYEKQPPASAASAAPEKPVDIILAAMRPLQIAIDGLSASFSVLSKIRSGTVRAELKTALRSCIDQLEELYGRI